MSRSISTRAINPINNWLLVLLACLTLGLAPYTPEPHIVGKLRWALGGAAGMQWIDWGDLLFHAIPWLLLIRLIVLRFRRS
jgi:hypothetical protein